MLPTLRVINNDKLNRMKKLIDITDEDVIKMIDCVHILTDNKILSRDGILGLSFEKSFKKYGSCSISIELASIDRFD